MDRVLFSSASDHWATPKAVYDALHQEFGFNDDPCPLHSDQCGLSREWGGVSFCNPPYSDIKNWCKKAYEEHQKGKTVVLLIPSRTDTRYWHDYCMKAQEIRFLRGRLRFGSATENAPFPSAIIIFKGSN